MRSLSVGQAASCEAAKTTRCACRCGGVFHGAARVADVADLSADDPHHVAVPRRRRRKGQGRPAADDVVHTQQGDD